MSSSRLLHTICLLSYWILHCNVHAIHEGLSKYCPAKEHVIPAPCVDQCLEDGQCPDGSVCCVAGCLIESEFDITERYGRDFYTACLPIEWCEFGVCHNGAECISRLIQNKYSYRCECAPGYEGRNCTEDIDDCKSSPCQHGGQCSDLINDYKCCCPPGRTGKSCEYEVDRECKHSKLYEDSCLNRKCKKHKHAKCVMKPHFMEKKRGRLIDVTDDCDDFP